MTNIQKSPSLISVIMPAFNTEKYVGLSIESVLRQTYTNFELIIIDDASTDETWKIIQEFAAKDTRIKPYHNEYNKGYIQCHNFAFDLAKGAYIAKMDSDDYCDKERFQKQVLLIEKTGADICSTNLIYVDSAGAEITKRSYDIENFENIMKVESPISDPSVLMRKEVLDKYGYYDERFEGIVSYDLWLRLWKNKCVFVLCEDFIYYYRQHGTSIKSRKTKKTIRNSIRIKLHAMKSYGISFGIRGWIRIIQEVLLLFLPTKLILKLFYFSIRSRNK